jgi:hypothetical protein
MEPDLKELIRINVSVVAELRKATRLCNTCTKINTVVLTIAAAAYIILFISWVQL